MERDVRPRVALVGYGSLITPAELAALSDDAPDRAFPVKIEGLRRTFDQRTSWRSDDDVKCAVANAVRDPDAWMNGVLIPTVDRDEFATFRERERWYRLIEVPFGDIVPYDEDDRDRLERTDLVLTTTGLETDPDIEPIPGYVADCLESAGEWGEEFRDDFVESTATNAGKPVTEYRE